MVELQKLPGATAPSRFGYIGAALAIAEAHGPPDRGRDVTAPGSAIALRGVRQLRARRGALAELTGPDLPEQHAHRSGQDLSDVAVRDLMAQQRPELLDLLVQVAVGCKLDRVPLAPERLPARSRLRFGAPRVGRRTGRSSAGSRGAGAEAAGVGSLRIVAGTSGFGSRSASWRRISSALRWAAARISSSRFAGVSFGASRLAPVTWILPSRTASSSPG
jgi:hypothetical protein